MNWIRDLKNRDAGMQRTHVSRGYHIAEAKRLNRRLSSPAREQPKREIWMVSRLYDPKTHGFETRDDELKTKS